MPAAPDLLKQIQSALAAFAEKPLLDTQKSLHINQRSPELPCRSLLP